jgi:hypothetical protein
MNKRYFIIGLILLFFMFSCQDEDEIIGTIGGKIVLVYMVADNSLSNVAKTNIDSLEAGMSLNSVPGRVIVYVDCADENPMLLELVRERDGSVSRQIIKTYVEQNSVSIAVMASVLTEMTELFPSDSYGLVLWLHGYGWLPTTTNSASKTICRRSFGRDGGDEMDIADLVTALSAGPHFDYILFDACFMGGVETAYALRNCADYLMASPTEVLSDGFPYSEMVPYMLGYTKAGYIRMTSLYYEHYNAMPVSSRSAAVSCVRCDGMEAMAVETGVLIGAHAAELNSFRTDSIQYFDSFSPHLFFDFGHFMESLTTPIQREFFERQLKRTVVYKACTDSVISVNGCVNYLRITRFSGLSFYIPSDDTGTQNTFYQTLEWYRAAGWDNTVWQ